MTTSKKKLAAAGGAGYLVGRYGLSRLLLGVALTLYVLTHTWWGLLALLGLVIWWGCRQGWWNAIALRAGWIDPPQVVDRWCAVYRYLSFRLDGVIVWHYIGKAFDPYARREQHRRDRRWWALDPYVVMDVLWFPSERAALEAEARMIRELKPSGPDTNVQHNRQGVL